MSGEKQENQKWRLWDSGGVWQGPCNPSPRPRARMEKVYLICCACLWTSWPPFSRRSQVGGQPLQLAWCRGRRISRAESRLVYLRCACWVLLSFLAYPLTEKAWYLFYTPKKALIWEQRALGPKENLWKEISDSGGPAQAAAQWQEGRLGFSGNASQCR